MLNPSVGLRSQSLRLGGHTGVRCRQYPCRLAVLSKRQQSSWWGGPQQLEPDVGDQQVQPTHGPGPFEDWRDPFRLLHLKADTQTEQLQNVRPRTQAPRLLQPDTGGGGGGGGSDLPKKLGIIAGLVLFSRLGVYIPLPGVDVAAFAGSIKTEGLLGYIDTLSGGSISRVGIFSLGIVPYINASICLQLLGTAIPQLKELQKEGGSQGRKRFKLYQQLVAFAFALVQAAGQELYLKPYVPEYSATWFAVSLAILSGGAMVLVKTADVLDDLKLGNGTSILITANIASALPTSVGAAVQQATARDSSNLAVYVLALFLVTLGVVYVQEAERKIPMNYASRYRTSALERQSYLPFKVNATGVMPVIFASTLVSLPTTLGRNVAWLEPITAQLSPTKPLFLPANIVLIAAFNYYYTFLQLEPKEMAEQLKRSGASIPGIRPGRATAQYVTGTLERMSILGSAFLAALSAAPQAVELITKLQAFRGFAGTSILILVGVATDSVRRVRAEQAMQRYGDTDRLYDDFKM